MVEYHVHRLLQLHDIVYKSGEKGHFVGWFSISMKLVEGPVICLGQYEAIFKQYIFTKKMWTHKGKCQLFPKDEGYGIIIFDFRYRSFGFVYPLTSPDLQNINTYCALRPKYFDTDAETTIL